MLQSRTTRRSSTEQRRSRVISIVLADPQHVIRRGIRCLVEMQDDLRVVGETANPLRVAGLVARLKPRILIVVTGMAALSAFEVIRQARQVSPATAVIVLSRHAHEGYIVHALRTGASGYVVTSARPIELVRAIRKVIAGDHYVSSPRSELPIEAWLQRIKTEAVDTYETLTRREREVLHLVSEGLTNARVASRLSISRRTVEAHRASVMQKMSFAGLAELIRYVVEREIEMPVERLL